MFFDISDFFICLIQKKIVILQPKQQNKLFAYEQPAP